MYNIKKMVISFHSSCITRKWKYGFCSLSKVREKWSRFYTFVDRKRFKVKAKGFLSTKSKRRCLGCQSVMHVFPKGLIDTGKI